MKRIFKFNREVDDFDVWRWYVDLPEWEGSKADLEMVAGADVMLEYLREKDESSVELVVSEELIRDVDVVMNHDKDGNYVTRTFTKDYHEFDHNVWLCEVTLFVFGYYPTHLYLKVL